jgi:hypothetical protein
MWGLEEHINTMYEKTSDVKDEKEESIQELVENHHQMDSES